MSSVNAFATQHNGSLADGEYLASCVECSYLGLYAEIPGTFHCEKSAQASARERKKKD